MVSYARKYDVSENLNHYRLDGIRYKIRKKLSTRKGQIGLDARKFSCAKISTYSTVFYYWAPLGSSCKATNDRSTDLRDRSLFTGRCGGGGGYKMVGGGCKTSFIPTKKGVWKFFHHAECGGGGGGQRVSG